MEQEFSSSQGALPSSLRSDPLGITPQDIAETLDKAADLIEPPGAWTQAAFARSGRFLWWGGKECFPLSPKARSWSMWGAVQRVTGVGRHARLLEARSLAAVDRSLGRDFLFWHERSGRTQAEVVAALRQAAADARALSDGSNATKTGAKPRDETIARPESPSVSPESDIGEDGVKLEGKR